jgi:hypothetical protein
MSRIVLVTSFALLLSSEILAQGLKFQKTSADSLFIIPELEGKPAFLVAGIHHCGYSVKSINELAQDSIVDEFMNENFVNLYFPTRESESEFLKLFDIKDYPRYFFISPEGEVLAMRATYKKPKKVKKMAEKILKGRRLKPNILMYAGKAYKKRRATLDMLTHTAQAYKVLHRKGFDILDENSAADVSLSASERASVARSIELSKQYGEYSTNLLIERLFLTEDQVASTSAE